MAIVYVTHDLDKAMELVGNRYGVEKFDRFDPDMVVNTPDGEVSNTFAVDVTAPAAIAIAVGHEDADEDVLERTAFVAARELHAGEHRQRLIAQARATFRSV